MLGITKQQLATLAVLATGAFITILNQTLLSPALPTIMGDLNVDASTVQWLTTGFTLVNAIMIPVTAFLTDRFSIRNLFLWAMGIFTLGSAIAYFAPSFGLLLAGRVVQAAGAGILMPMVSTVLLITFPVDKRGMAMGLFGIVIGVAPAIGPTLSGVIIDHVSWRWLFAGVSVLGLIGIIVGSAVIRNVTKSTNPNAHLDKPSVILSTLGFGALLYGFSAIGSYGPSLVLCLPVLLGTCALWLFFRRQLRLDTPMLRVDIMRNRKFTVGTVVGMIVQAAIMANSILIPIFVQTICGFSATISGLVMLPSALLMGIAGPIAGKLFDKHGPRAIVIAGTVTLTLSTLPLAFIDQSTGMVYLCVVMAIRNLALGFINMPVTTWGMNSLDNRLINHGNALNNSLRQVAGSFGAALTISVYSLVMAGNVSALQAAGDASAIAAASTGGYVISAGVIGMDVAFGMQTLICAAAAIMAIIAVRDKATDHLAADPTGERRATLESIMKREVFTLPQTATVTDVAQLFIKHGISAAPIVDDNSHILGMISDGDIVRILSRRGMSVLDPIAMIINSEKQDPDFQKHLNEVMASPALSLATTHVITIDIHSSFDEVCRLLGENHLRKAPVVEGDKLVGVINRSDLTTYALSTCMSGKGATRG